MTGQRRIIVAGGGASGLAAAIAASREGADVTIIEKTASCGKKLSMTGNGRCNLSNTEMSPECFNEASRERVSKWLERFGVNETVEFFSSMGLVITNEGGYLYPASGQASSVVDVLMSECRRLAVNIIYGEQVKAVTPYSKDRPYCTVRTDKNTYEADRVIIATGGRSGPSTCKATGDGYYICEMLGMRVIPDFPALVPLLSDDDSLPEKSGVRSIASVSFMTGGEIFASEYGEVQITKDGISGIPVLQASGRVAHEISKGKKVTASIDLFPGYTEEEFEELTEGMTALPGERNLSEFLEGFGNSNINEMILKRMKLSPSMKIKNVGKNMLKCIMYKYRDLRIDINAAGDFKKAQATMGGVSLWDVDDYLGCRRAPGVYVVGELCDVDGRCGGYNLQWAWMSGYIAGEAAGCL